MNVPQHPVQTHARAQYEGAKAPTCVTLKAYEVYKHVHGAQPAMVEGNCRGGFCAGELIAFLYAASFPKNEWSVRVDEALKGMENL